MNTEYETLCFCFDYAKLEEWVKANTAVANGNTDQEEHTWTPRAKEAIDQVFANFKANGLTCIMTEE